MEALGLYTQYKDHGEVKSLGVQTSIDAVKAAETDLASKLVELRQWELRGPQLANKRSALQASADDFTNRLEELADVNNAVEDVAEEAQADRD